MNSMLVDVFDVILEVPASTTKCILDMTYMQSLSPESCS